ncbi:2-oxo acid dehydrogenase subunit E2 [Dactylosporangium roseum]|uniref:Dihydrolipoamide acetyltransferase component of pyruvate dehydrogenase complex n=1 Tax=Dactylosporangium roseum TaxID=47989 RepID=A0ABY5ZDY9_9ACTN|nr:dihydrolipoamide acetyltransferase family protein [Dactylosporangium roseum]UWZ39165.1 2-oxo acid dehydrogenase subunit E2 [Dactylosporangium roseum]
MPEFRLPDLGEGLGEAEIVAWHVQVGDSVVVDQNVVEVETAKAAVEVPIPFAGVVSTLHAEPGDVVAVGAPLITVTAAGSGGGREGFREPGIVTARDPGEASGNVLIGYGTPASSPGRRRGGRGPARTGNPALVAAPQPAGAHGSGPVRVINPIVRKLARDAGLDLAAIRGTGSGGLVRRRDVELALTARAGADSHVPEAVAREAVAPGEGERRIPIRGLRKATADKLSRSRREIPEATVWVDVDVTELLTARSRLNAGDPRRPVGVLALLARFTVLALRRFPELNGRIEGDELVLPAAVHLGFAAQTDRGLIVPVVHDAHRMSTRDLAAAVADRTAAARAGLLAPAGLTGGTFTVNNYGVFGVDGSAAIINHPEVGILGMGRIIDKPWVVDGALAVRKVSQLTLAFDHRACDGGTAGGFLRYVADCVEAPITALGDL